MFEEIKIIQAVNIALCTDEQKYLDIDSHYIHIPKDLFAKYTRIQDLNTTCFEISNALEYGNENQVKVHLAKIEPATGQFSKNVLLPDWVCKKINIDDFGSRVTLKLIKNPKIIKRIKIQGNKSSYVEMDIKSLLEKKIEQFRCINLGIVFHINGVVFNVCELISNDNEPINYGITSSELEIDFDTPDDIKYLEKRKEIMDKILLKIEEKKNIKTNKTNLNSLSNSNVKKSGIFKFSDLKKDTQCCISDSSEKSICLDGICDELILETESNTNNDKSQIENEKKMIREIIEEGKNKQKQMEEELVNMKKNTDVNTNPSTNNLSEQKNIFETKGKKLIEENNPEKKVILTKEEIKKLRLQKLS